MANKVYIMRGHSGSGKSTYARKHFPNAFIVSADDFWLDENGNYNFDAKRLGEAHDWALRLFIDSLAEGGLYPPRDVVVDNTNTTVAEIAPYYRVASALGWDAEIITLDKDNVSVEEGAARNVHRVPVEAVRRQAENLRRASASIPRHWKHTIVTQDE